jgi:signal transduction histidine kinase
VRNLAESDLERADELLASATDQVQTMIGDVRRLIYGLRPPALDEVGLVASLRGLASREGSPQTRVDVEAPDSLPPLEAAVEVAAYWIVQEALTNVARHARARRCAVASRVRADGAGAGGRRRRLRVLGARRRCRPARDARTGRRARRHL